MPDCVKGNTLQHCLILGDSRQPSLLLPLNACTAVLLLSSRSVYIWTERCGFCFDVGFYFIFFFCVDFFSHARERPSQSVERDSSLVLGCHPRFPWHVDGRQGGKKKREEGGWRAVEVKIRRRYLCVNCFFFCLFTSNETRILSFFFSFLEIDLYTKDKTLKPLSVFIAITYNSTTPHPPSLWSGFIIKAHQTIAPVTMSAPFCFWCSDLDNCDGNYNKWPLYFKVRRPSLSKSIWVTINLIIP